MWRKLFGGDAEHKPASSKEPASPGLSVPQNMLPRHIAIVMDGNGRWAKAKGNSRSAGHEAGARTLKRIVRAASAMGIEVLTVYAFSTENWKRPTDEIAALMGLVLTSLEDEIFMKNNVRFRVIGDRERLPEEVQEKLRETEQHTEKNAAMTMVVALSYSARWEITQAMKEIVTEHQQGHLRNL